MDLRIPGLARERMIVCFYRFKVMLLHSGASVYSACFPLRVGRYERVCLVFVPFFFFFLLLLVLLLCFLLLLLLLILLGCSHYLPLLSS